MLITDEFEWSYSTFEAHIEGMCRQVAAHPSHIIPFLAPITPETILTLFATWKIGKIAFPLNPKNPIHPPNLFQPAMPSPTPSSSTAWNLAAHATYLYTSGSSGKPKIACHTLQNHFYSARGSNLIIPLSEQSIWSLALPLYHVGGLAILFRCYLAKAKVLLTKDLTQNLIRSTHLSLVPTQLYRLLRDGTFNPKQTILLGGAPLPSLPYPNILPTYGMTEMSSQIVTDHTLHPHAEMTLANSDEIWVRGGVLFQGYVQENSLHLPLNSEGWFETGDLGRWNNGRFEIVGRKDNLFISGGENIQPEEIEMVIREHCNLEEAIVVPLADEEFGFRPAVFLEDPTQLAHIQSQLAQALPKFKIPTRAFPLPASRDLKPNRKLLTQAAAALAHAC